MVFTVLVKRGGLGEDYFVVGVEVVGYVWAEVGSPGYFDCFERGVFR